MSNHRPPKWADRFLRWYCNPKYFEEIQGDIHELFDMRIEEKGKAAADRSFIWDVFRFLRWSNIKRSNSNYQKMNQLGLYRNYLKLGFRNINRNLVTSSINIFGLAIAIGVAITIFIFIDIQVNMNHFHTKSDRIYQLVNTIKQEGEDELWSHTPIPLAPKLVSDLPFVEASARIEYTSAIVRQNKEAFHEWIAFTDPSYMEIFDFPLIYGNKQVLYEKNQIVISHDMAIKYFGDEDPMGQEIFIEFSNDTKKRFLIGAVMDKFLYNDNLRHHFYIPISNFFDSRLQDQYDWSYLTDATFVLLKEGQDVQQLKNSYNEWIALQHGSNPEWLIQDFEAISLNELALRSYAIVGGIGHDNHPAARIPFILIALSLLGMACFNFMNMAVTSAAKRLKEIGLRKVMGGTRKQIIGQFLVENTLQCFFSLIVGTMLAYFLIVPGFDSIIPLDLQFRAFSPLHMVAFFVILLLIVGLLSGAYPALYISRFDPVVILKGNQKFGTGNTFSKVFLGFQLFLAVMMIVGSIIATDQFYHFTQKDWGYNPSSTLVISVSDNQQYEQLRNTLSDHPDVEFVAASKGHIGISHPKKSVEFLDRKVGARVFGVTQDYFDVLKLRLKEGRFITNRALDQESSVVVNEKFVAQMGWENPINQVVTIDSVRLTVVGILQDFHYDQFFMPINPALIYGAGDISVNYMSVRTKSGKTIEVDDYLKKAWLEIAPNDPYQRYFQEGVFDQFYENMDANMILSIIMSSVALLLSCLGLYALLSFNVQKKLKEFGIRKVLGATPQAIMKVAGKQYAWIIGMAFFVGAPLGFLGILSTINDLFPDPKEITYLPILLSILIISTTLIITIVGQVRKATKVNPASILRTD